MSHDSSKPATSDNGFYVSNHRAGSQKTKENVMPLDYHDVPLHKEYSDSQNSNQASSHSHPHTDPSNNNNQTNETLKNHPPCQFLADKQWLDCQFHDLEKLSIKKPDEVENQMVDPPNNYDAEVLNRIQGSMIGMALGDALGAHVEFRPREYLRQNPVVDLQGGGTWGLTKGQFTDDTSMALCLANSLVARRGFVPYDQLVRYKWWHINGYMSSTGKCFDIGAATQQSLTEFTRRQKTFAKENNIEITELDFLSDENLLKKFDVMCSEDGVAGNGALMRLAPVPLFFYKHPKEAVEFSGISGKITHGDQKADDACRYYGALIVAALQGEKKEQLLDKNFYRNHQDWFGAKTLHPDIMEIAEGSYQKKGGYDEGIRGKGYIVNALEAALWAFWSDEGSFKTGALAAVNLGDDADTTAAIYGQLAGAYYGYRNLPKEWVDQVYAKKFMEILSKWMAYEGQRWQSGKAPISLKNHSDTIGHTDVPKQIHVGTISTSISPSNNNSDTIGHTDVPKQTHIGTISTSISSSNNNSNTIRSPPSSPSKDYSGRVTYSAVPSGSYHNMTASSTLPPSSHSYTTHSSPSTPPTNYSGGMSSSTFASGGYHNTTATSGLSSNNNSNTTLPVTYLPKSGTDATTYSNLSTTNRYDTTAASGSSSNNNTNTIRYSPISPSKSHSGGMTTSTFASEGYHNTTTASGSSSNNNSNTTLPVTYLPKSGTDATTYSNLSSNNNSNTIHYSPSSPSKSHSGGMTTSTFASRSYHDTTTASGSSSNNNSNTMRPSTSVTKTSYEIKPSSTLSPKNYPDTMVSSTLSPKNYLDTMVSSTLSPKNYPDTMVSSTLSPKNYPDTMVSSTSPTNSYYDTIIASSLLPGHYSNTMTTSTLPPRTYSETMASSTLPSNNYSNNMASSASATKSYYDGMSQSTSSSKNFSDTMGKSTLPTKAYSSTMPPSPLKTNSYSPSIDTRNEVSNTSTTYFGRESRVEPSNNFGSSHYSQMSHATSTHRPFESTSKVTESRNYSGTHSKGENTAFGMSSYRESKLDGPSTNKPSNLNRRLSMWTVNDVGDWLQSLDANYAIYVGPFRNNKVDGFSLWRYVSDDVLIEYGVTNPNHRQKIIEGIGRLKQDVQIKSWLN